MATQNPMGGEQIVPLDLPTDQISLLRVQLTDWLAGVREDLKTPAKLKHPNRARQEAQAYERLLVALTVGQIAIPDETARAAIQAATDGYDKESNYAEIAANHDALHGLLAVLGGETTA